MNRMTIIAAGIVCAAAGVLLRLNAQALAWPSSFSYSGPRSDTIWAIREQAIQDLSIALLAFGLVVLLLVVASWLWPQNRQV